MSRENEQKIDFFFHTNARFDAYFPQYRLFYGYFVKRGEFASVLNTYCGSAGRAIIYRNLNEHYCDYDTRHNGINRTQSGLASGEPAYQSDKRPSAERADGESG